MRSAPSGSASASARNAFSGSDRCSRTSQHTTTVAPVAATSIRSSAYTSPVGRGHSRRRDRWRRASAPRSRRRRARHRCRGRRRRHGLATTPRRGNRDRSRHRNGLSWTDEVESPPKPDSVVVVLISLHRSACAVPGSQVCQRRVGVADLRLQFVSESVLRPGLPETLEGIDEPPTRTHGNRLEWVCSGVAGHGGRSVGSVEIHSATLPLPSSSPVQRLCGLVSVSPEPPRGYRLIAGRVLDRLRLPRAAAGRLGSCRQRT